MRVYCILNGSLNQAELKNVTVSATDNGGYTFTLTPTEENVLNFPFLKQVLQKVGAQGITKKALSFAFNAEKEPVRFEITVTAEVQQEVADFSYAVDYTSANQNVSISAPSDAAEHTTSDRFREDLQSFIGQSIAPV